MTWLRVDNAVVGELRRNLSQYLNTFQNRMAVRLEDFIDNLSWRWGRLPEEQNSEDNSAELGNKRGKHGGHGDGDCTRERRDSRWIGT